MQAPFISGAGEAPTITSSIVVALYDRETGTVLHLHTVHMHEGAREVSESEAIEQAQRNARALGHGADRLGIAVSTDVAHGELPHRVDPATGAFQSINVLDSAH
jgi:hypothetical protein